MDINSIWQKALSLIENEVTIIAYETYLLKMTPVSFENDDFVFEVDDRFAKHTIDRKHLGLIETALKHVTNKQNINVITIIKGEDYTPKEETRKPLPEQKNLRSPNGLLSKFRFENFIVGSSNQLAYSAAVAVSEMPGDEYNPLFLYGGVGLGKTHLMNAIGNEAIENSPDYKILYVTCEQFMNELLKCIEQRTTEKFRSKYRELDFLLIDDIQFIAGKTQTQEEFFHTFNELLFNGKQIVITSDSPPNEIKQLEDRLVSRFQAGLTVDLQQPAFETRVAILRDKARALNFDVPDEILQYIAQNIKSNIRELEGTLNRFQAYSKLSGELTLDIAEELIADMIKMNRQKITIEYIQEVVASHYGFSIDDLKSSNKERPLAKARQSAMYLCRKLLNEHYKQIGRKFGDKDHSTVMFACKKVGQMIEEDDDFKNTILTLEKKINDM